MAIDLYGGDGLFDRIGKMGGILEVLHTDATDYEGYEGDLQDLYDDTDEDVYSAVQAQARDAQLNAYLPLGAAYKALAKKTLLKQVNDHDLAFTHVDNATAMKELITYMTDQSENVQDGASTFAVDGGSSTNATVVCSLTRVTDGNNEVNAIREKLVINCTNSGTTYASFTISSRDKKSSDSMSHLWLNASGVRNKSLPSTLVQTQYVTNGGFETFTVANTPDDWTLVAGAAGTNFFSENSIVYGGSKSLKIVETAGPVVPQIKQAVTLTALTEYCIGIRMRRVSAGGAAGTVAFVLKDGNGTTLQTEYASSNSVSVNVSDITSGSYGLHTGFFRTPSSLPTAVYLHVTVDGMPVNDIVYLDSMTLTTTTKLYPGGPALSLHMIAAGCDLDDRWTLTIGGTEGKMQRVFDRIFDMRGLNLVLPYDATPTVDDALVAV